MTGVGMDLLEIDRLERALARRPRLAERLFTDAERAFAAARGAARAPPRRALLRQGGGGQGARAARVGLARRRGRGGGDEPPAVRLAGAAAARAGELGAAAVQVSLTHSQGHGGRGGGGAREPARAGWSRCPTPSACAPRTAGRSRSAGIPWLELMERAGEGLARVVAQRCPRAGSRWSAARATTAATGSSPPACCARPAATSTCCCLGPGRAAPATPRRSCARCPAPPPEPYAADRLAGAAAIVDALLGTGFAGAPREPAAGVIAATSSPRARGGRRRRARAASTPRRARWRAPRCAPRSPPPSTAPSPACGSRRARSTRGASR